MTPEQIESFVREPRIADLATVKPDGSPHVAPVWYLYDGHNFLVMTGKTTVKTGNIERDPRVSLSIATNSEPYEYVLVNGTAEITEAGLPELVYTISMHYKGEEDGRRYADQAVKDIDYCVLTIKPVKISSWSDSE
jgi:hypothetical protein